MSATPNQQFYVVGGTVNPDSPSYVVRRADQELFDRVMAGEFCYVLTSRQMGKSSLMARAAKRLSEAGLNTAIVDLNHVGTEKGKQSAAQWYYGIAHRILRELDMLDVDLDQWWQSRSSLPALQRLTEFFGDLLLERVAGQIVIFIDEVDSTISLPFTDDFFAAIRACYNARAVEPDYKRLSFVLVGVASPSDLMKDDTRTPFNIGRRIELTDFAFEEAKLLATGLSANAQQGEWIMRRIFGWTGGHPYLTQRLCQVLQQRAYRSSADPSIALNASDVDADVDGNFFTQSAFREDFNLSFIRDWLTRNKDLSQELLETYCRIIKGNIVVYDPLSPTHNSLKLSGLVISFDNSTLRVRNRIYERVFTYQWAVAAMPIDLTKYYVIDRPLNPDAPSYVTRNADNELYEGVLAGKFCYVLTSRQMGKSSLMARAAKRLSEAGLNTAVVDLTTIGIGEDKRSADQWHFGVAHRILRELNIRDVDLNQWWQSRSSLPALQRLTGFFGDLLLERVAGQIVIFIDEVDSTISLPFMNHFFVAIRACYDARAVKTDYKRLGFVMVGVASFSDLINDPTRTPFTIGHRIELTDFTFEEARPLARGLSQDEYESARILQRILDWTGGHPYLTQKLCQAIQKNRDHEGADITDQDIQSLVEQCFLSKTASYKDSNLKFVRDWLTGDKKLRGRALELYCRIHRGEDVAAAPYSPVQNYLELSGIVESRPKSILRVRNRIYERVFTADWAKRTDDAVAAFWRAVVWLLIVLGAQTAASLISEEVESFYSQFLFYYIARGLSSINKNVQSIALGEMSFVLLAGWFSLWLLWYLRMSWRGETRLHDVPKAFFLQILRLMSLLAPIYLAFWGLNYQRTPLAETLGFDRIPARAGELESIGLHIVSGVNSYYDQARESGGPAGKRPVPPSRDAIFKAIEQAFQNEKLLGDASRGNLSDPKPLALSRLTSRAGISGFYIPFTGEVTFNTDVPAFDLPMVIAHYKAHQRGYAREDEANFVGYIVCINSTEPFVRYSGYLYGLKVLEILSAGYMDRYNDMLSRINDGPREDLRERSEFWEGVKSPTLSALSRRIFSLYLGVNRIHGGVKNFDEDSPLIIGYYLKYPAPQPPDANLSDVPKGNLEPPRQKDSRPTPMSSLSLQARQVADQIELLRSNYAAAIGLWMNNDGTVESLGSRRTTPTERQLYDTLTFLLTSARSLASLSSDANTRQRAGKQLRADTQTARQMWQRVKPIGVISQELDRQWQSMQNNLRSLITAALR